MHPLFYYINKYASTLISKEEFKVLKSYFIHKKLRKRQYLLQEGEIGKHLAFIVKGALRQYYIDEKGVECVVNLYVENGWAGDRESFAMSTPSIYYIEAREDCEVLLISRENMLRLCKESMTFNEFQLKLDERCTIAVQKRLTSISLTAEQRYKCFVEICPKFVNRFPQHIIASYLGITKDTLSRVRKKSLKKPKNTLVS